MSDISLTVNVNERRAFAVIPFLKMSVGNQSSELRDLLYSAFAKPNFVFSDDGLEITVSFPVDYAPLMGAELWNELAKYPIPIEDEIKRLTSELVISEYITQLLLPMTRKMLSDKVQSLLGKQEKE